MDAFDAPMAAIDREDALRRRLLRCPTRDPQRDITRVHAGFLVDGFALDQKDLTDMGEVAGRIERCTTLNAPRLPATMLGRHDLDEIRDAARLEQPPPWKRRGSTKVLSSSKGYPKRACQSPATRRSVSDSTREPTFGQCPSGRIRQRLWLAISLSRPYCERKSQLIQRSRTPHCRAAADRLSGATHCSFARPPCNRDVRHHARVL